jgi:hypothetical protein
MISTPTNYFTSLTTELGSGWNRFWFAPSDPIALGVLRIAVGLIALYTLATYTPDLERYFGPNGLVPVGMLASLEEQTRDIDRQAVPGQVREAMPREYRFSYLDRLHSGRALLTAHLVGLAVVAMFTVGLFSRLTSVASLIVFLSYLHRGPMLTAAAEPLVAILIFYLALGPSGSACSLDHWLAVRRRQNEPLAIGQADTIASSWATVPLRLIQVHLALIYAMMVLGKLGNDNWWSGLGIWWLIARTESRMIDLSGLHQLPLVVSAWSYAVMLWQAMFPILIWNRLARPLLLLVNAVMWLLLAPVLGNLPLAAVMIAASLSFVSPEWLRSLVSGRRDYLDQPVAGGRA